MGCVQLYIKSNFHSNTRFTERVFIPDKRTRDLTQRFCAKGLSSDEFLTLYELIRKHASSLSALLDLANDANASNEVFTCPPIWSPLLQALARTSPVCALIHPNDALISLLNTMDNKDITTDVQAMELLQKEVPLLFSLLRVLKGSHSNILLPIINTMIEKSNAPFTACAISNSSQEAPSSEILTSESELAYFPSLLQIRKRGCYTADKANQKEKLCTKQSHGHPTLLPGIFTLYCEHGKNTAYSHVCNVSITLKLWYRYLLWVSSHEGT